jgi:cysteine desulfurase / selenocysteine lyase
MLANERQALLKAVPVDSNGQLRPEELQRLLNDRTKIVSVAHVSNALGTITPVREIVEMAHRVGACVLLDGAQSVSHLPVDMQALDADFYVFSGHKIYGPTGIGVLYGKQAILEDMRASLALYNTREEVDTCVAVLREVTAAASRS